MVYTLTEGTFEKLYEHRDASVFPGTDEFTELLGKYSRQINDYMGVDSDTTDRADSCSEIVAALIESFLKWKEDQSNPDKQTVLEPSIFDDEHVGLQRQLDAIAGYLDSEDDPAYAYDLSGYGGGFLY